jgi:hypothetical protein
MTPVKNSASNTTSDQVGGLPFFGKAVEDLLTVYEFSISPKTTFH